MHGGRHSAALARVHLVVAAADGHVHARARSRRRRDFAKALQVIRPQLLPLDVHLAQHPEYLSHNLRGRHRGGASEHPPLLGDEPLLHQVRLHLAGPPRADGAAFATRALQRGVRALLQLASLELRPEVPAEQVTPVIQQQKVRHGGFVAQLVSKRVHDVLAFKSEIHDHLQRLGVDVGGLREGVRRGYHEVPRQVHDVPRVRANLGYRDSLQRVHQEHPRDQVPGARAEMRRQVVDAAFDLLEQVGDGLVVERK